MTQEVPSSSSESSSVGSQVSRRAIKFEDLKPVCCDVMKTPTVEKLSRFLQTMQSLPPGSLTPEIMNYVLFPLAVHLKSIKSLQTPVRIFLMQCIEEALAKGTVEDFKCFMDLFQTFSMILVLPSRQTSVEIDKNLPEELVHSIEGSLIHLLKNITPDNRDALLGKKFVQSIGHSVYMQLQIINSEFPSKSRLKAVDIVETLFSFGKHSDDARKNLLGFLPGVVIALRKAASLRSGRTKVDLALRAVEVFTVAVVVTASADDQEDVSKADQNLLILLKDLSQEHIHFEDDRIRKTLMYLSKRILIECDRYLPQCSEILWRNILILCWDPETAIAVECRQFLSQNIAKTYMCSFEKVLSYMKTAKSLYIGGNLEDALVSLKCVASSFCVQKLLHIELSTFLPILANFLTVAIVKNAFELDKTAEEIAYRPNPLLKACDDLCTCVSLAASLEDIVEETVPFITFNATLEFSQRLENNFLGTLCLFNKTLLAFLAQNPSSLSSYNLTNIASLYIDILDNEATDRKKVIPKVAGVLEHESVLLIVGLGILCRADPVSVLPNVLYYFLELAGNEYSEIVSRVTLNVLTEIASALSGMSLNEFLVENLDLLLSELSVRVSSIRSHENCPSALVFLAKYFDFSRAEFTQIIQRAFLQSCDQFYSSSQKLFVKIFYAYMLSLWEQRRKDLEAPAVESGNTKSTLRESLCQKLLNYQRSLGISVNSNLEDIMESPDGNEEANESAKPEAEDMDVEAVLTKDLQLVLSICERVLNFLPTHEDRTVQIISMDCLIYGVQLLRSQENALLPLAHKIWPNLSSRFTDADMTVVRKSFDLLLALCKSSGSFLRKRLVQEVFPKLSSLLINLATESERVEHKNTLYYTYTQAFKLQAALLEGMADLCLCVELSEEELNQVVSGCLLYLKPQQHKNLREAALRVIDNFARDRRSSSVIWMKLIAHGLRQPPPSVAHSEYLPLSMET